MKKNINFVVSKTPLRVSFLGGGSDILNYYGKKISTRKYGSVLNTSINKFVYVTVKKHGKIFKENYRLNYSKTENVKYLSQIKNKIIKECLKYFKIKDKLYISSISDFPSGSGLGSSSSFCVGLINCINTMYNLKLSRATIAEIASFIEIKLLNQGIGKQDQYAATFGGFNYFKFFRNKVLRKCKNHEFNFLNNSLYLVWTNLTRDADKVLAKQRKNDLFLDQLHKNTKIICSKKKIDKDLFFKLVNESWKIKKSLSSSITNKKINFIIKKANDLGVDACKLSGAGSGGFILIISKKKIIDQLIFQTKCQCFHIFPVKYGTQIISKN